MVILQGEEEHMLDSKELKIQSKTWTRSVLREDKDVVDENTNIEGKADISHHEFNWYHGRAQNADDDHDTIVDRFHEDVINQRRHQVKVMMKQEVNGTTVMA